MAAVRKRQKRRQLRRAREAGRHDLRGQCAERDLPFMNGVGSAVIEDPYVEPARGCRCKA
jgi:hypothetical protein